MKKIEKPANTFRIASYNVHFGANTREIAAVFKSNKNLAQADVIFLQEIEHHFGENSPRAEKIAKLLNFHFFYAPARSVRRLGTHGLATLSRFPLREKHTLNLPRYNLIFNTRRRIALVSQAKVFGKKITLCNIHLDARLNAKQRISQLDFALLNLKKNYTGSIIVGGDLNTHPLFLAAKLLPVFYQDQYKLVHSHLVKRGFVFSGGPKGHTLKKVFLKMYLDHIYTNNLPVVNFGVELDVKASDHFPVWADLLIE